MEFAKRLKQIRLNAGLSQIEVAEKCGLSAQAYNNYEKRGYSPTPDLLVKFATALKTTPNKLLDFKETSITDIEYAKQHLDNIVISKNSVTIEGESVKGATIEKISKKEFSEICHIARIRTESLIEHQLKVVTKETFEYFFYQELCERTLPF